MAAGRKPITGPKKKPPAGLMQYDPQLESVEDLEVRVQKYMELHPLKIGNVVVREKRHRTLLLQLLPPSLFKTLQAVVKPRDPAVMTVPTLLCALRTARQRLQHAPRPANNQQANKQANKASMPNAKARLQLQRLQQGQGASVAAYVQQLDQLVLQCGYAADIEQAVAKDRLIIGLRGPGMRRRLTQMLDRPGGASYGELREFALRIEETGDLDTPIPLLSESMGNPRFGSLSDPMGNPRPNLLPDLMGNFDRNNMGNQNGISLGNTMRNFMGNPMGDLMCNNMGNPMGPPGGMGNRILQENVAPWGGNAMRNGDRGGACGPQGGHGDDYAEDRFQPYGGGDSGGPGWGDHGDGGLGGGQGSDMGTCTRCGLNAPPWRIAGILAANQCPRCCAPWPRQPIIVRRC